MPPSQRRPPAPARPPFIVLLPLSSPSFPLDARARSCPPPPVPPASPRGGVSHACRLFHCPSSAAPWTPSLPCPSTSPEPPTLQIPRRPEFHPAASPSGHTPSPKQGVFSGPCPRFAAASPVPRATLAPRRLRESSPSDALEGCDSPLCPAAHVSRGMRRYIWVTLTASEGCVHAHMCKCGNRASLRGRRH